MGRAFEVRKMSMAKTAAQKSKLYSKYGKQIYVCAKNSGADPEANASLRLLMDRAKREQVPGHVIDKAIEKAAGAGGEDYQPARYEGFGPGGCSVIIDCLTDNNKRTIDAVRLAFTKTNSKFGAPGSVSHMFDHLAVFQFAGDDSDTVLEALMEAEVDVTDVECDGGKVTVFAPSTEFSNTRQAIGSAFPDVSIDVEQITFVPQSQSELTESDMPAFEKFMNMLDECDDVQDVYHNAKLP